MDSTPLLHNPGEDVYESLSTVELWNRYGSLMRAVAYQHRVMQHAESTGDSRGAVVAQLHINNLQYDADCVFRLFMERMDSEDEGT